MYYYIQDNLAECLTVMGSQDMEDPLGTRQSKHDIDKNITSKEIKTPKKKRKKNLLSKHLLVRHVLAKHLSSSEIHRSIG